MTVHRRSRLVATAAAIVLVEAESVLVLVSQGHADRPAPEAVLEHARDGVSRNADWQPFAGRLDGLDLVLAPAGCFKMGSTEAQLDAALDSCDRFFGEGRCQVDFDRAEGPVHEVCFERPFWIGRTEVSNRMFGSSSNTDSEVMYRGPDWPRESVTWSEAFQFCSAHRARLPTEAEWEYAARGPDGLVYPWGDDFRPANLVAGRLSPASVASASECRSWVGAFDMSGGVAEWVADWYAPYAPQSETDSGGPAVGERRVLKGGSWFSFAAFYLRAAYRDSALPDTANSTVGFRCAGDLS